VRIPERSRDIARLLKNIRGDAAGTFRSRRDRRLPSAVAWEPDRSMNFGMTGHACLKNMNQRYMLVPEGGGSPGTQEPPSRSSPAIHNCSTVV